MLNLLTKTVQELLEDNKLRKQMEQMWYVPYQNYQSWILTVLYTIDLSWKKIFSNLLMGLSGSELIVFIQVVLGRDVSRSTQKWNSIHTAN